MAASLPKVVRKETDDLIAKLIELGLANDQNSTFIRPKGNDIYEVTFGNAAAISITLKDREYHEIYQQLVEARSYNVKFLDGAIIQIMYEFQGNSLRRHRLAFFPSPDFLPFQEIPNDYREDSLFLEIVSRRIVPFPIRFDFDVRENVAVDIIHPKCHLTLGQYEYCRIPVTAPLRPGWFIDFVVRNFYHTANYSHADDIEHPNACFDDSISIAERNLVHVTIPKVSAK